MDSILLAIASAFKFFKKLLLIFSFNAFVTVQVVALEVVQGNDRSNEKGEFYPTYPRPFTDSDETRMYKVFFANFYLNLNTWMVWQPATVCFFFPMACIFRIAPVHLWTKSSTAFKRDQE